MELVLDKTISDITYKYSDALDDIYTINGNINIYNNAIRLFSGTVTTQETTTVINEETGEEEVVVTSTNIAAIYSYTETNGKSNLYIGEATPENLAILIAKIPALIVTVKTTIMEQLGILPTEDTSTEDTSTDTTEE